jgi:FSR family fosmidomycin resistance protein-like MFS transporter
LPELASLLLEPAIGVLGDRGHRRRLIIGGGIVFAAALVVFACSASLALLLASLTLLFPASGAFVSLSQATLMDSAPEERDRNMLRWTIAGSVGALAGPVLVAAGAP